MIGADFVAKAPRDGSVLLLTSSSFLTAAATQTQLPYDPLAAFAPVAMIGQRTDAPRRLVLDVRIKSASGPARGGARQAGRAQLRHGGGWLHRASRRRSCSTTRAKVQMTHVPYKGAANAVTDLAGGQIQVMISNYSTWRRC